MLCSIRHRNIQTYKLPIYRRKKKDHRQSCQALFAMLHSVEYLTFSKLWHFINKFFPLCLSLDCLTVVIINVIPCVTSLLATNFKLKNQYKNNTRFPLNKKYCKIYQKLVYIDRNLQFITNDLNGKKGINECMLQFRYSVEDCISCKRFIDLEVFEICRAMWCYTRVMYIITVLYVACG